MKTRDAARSQKTILLAATDEFAKHGFAGARIDQIALAEVFHQSLKRVALRT